MLRDYQVTAVTAVEAAWDSGSARPALVMATGTGKTYTFVHVIDRALRTRRAGVAIILAHREELLDQAHTAITRAFPALRVGIVRQGRTEIRDKDVIIASVASVMGRRRGSDTPWRLEELVRAAEDSGAPPLVVIDECHRTLAPSYQAILKTLGCFDGKGIALGVTATLMRGKDGEGLGDVFDSVAHEYDIATAIADGWLAPIECVHVPVETLDLKRVPKTGGDFSAVPLGKVMSHPDVVDATVKAYGEHAPGRPGVVFVPSVESCHVYADAFSGAGYDVRAVWGEMRSSERKAAVRDFNEGRCQILVNCAVLTEGFDAPRTEVVVIARPTSSKGLFIQMVGRGTRPSPGTGKQSCLILDITGIAEAHGVAGVSDLGLSDEVDDEQECEGEDCDEEGSAPRESKPLAPIVIGSPRAVELLARSRRVWQKTHGGIDFCVEQEFVVFLIPAECELVHVGIRRMQSAPGTGHVVALNLPFDEAVNAAERRLGDGGMGLHRARWRKQPATMRQGWLAESIGLKLPDHLTRAEVSDAINVHIVSLMLDGGLKSQD